MLRCLDKQMWKETLVMILNILKTDKCMWNILHNDQHEEEKMGQWLFSEKGAGGLSGYLLDQ